MSKSSWEEFKDLFKTEEQRAKEKQQKIKDALEQEKAIADQMAALEKEYEDSLPKPDPIDFDALFPKENGLSEIEYTLPSDEDIAKSAEDKINSKKSDEASRLENKYLKSESALNDALQSGEKKYKENYDELGKLYSELQEKIKRNALRKGVARSSIVESQNKDLNKSKFIDERKILNDYNATMQDIDDKLNVLNQNREKALENLDVKYALELSDEIDRLKKERKKTETKYDEYNAKVRHQNAEYAIDRQKKINAYLYDAERKEIAAKAAQDKYEKENGYSGAKHDNYQKRYELAFNFYSSLSPDVALEALKASPNMKHYLGNYYDTLYKELYAQKHNFKEKHAV